MTILQLHIVSTDVLGNTTSFTSNHVGVADMVEQRSLTMVNVTHHRYDRSARDQIVLIILLLCDGILYLSRNIFGGKAKLVSHDVDGLCIQTLIDRHHDTDAHTSTDNLVDTHVHHGSQLRNSHEFGQLQNLALCSLSSHLLVHALSYSVTLLLAILGTLLVEVGLRCQTSQRLFYLTCYCLIVHLQGLHRTVLLVLLATTLLVLLLLTIVIIVVLILLVLLVSLLGSCLDIHLIGTDALTLATLAGSLFLTLLATLFLRLLLRTSALVER